MNVAIIILAAGKGTRMKSDLPKVLHLLNEKPLIQYVLDTACKVHPQKIVLVVGHGADLVKQAVGHDVSYVYQIEQLGTGHAVQQAEPVFQDYHGNILAKQALPLLILYGDMPLITAQTLRKMIEIQYHNPSPLTILTVKLASPRGFGRILRDETGAIKAIIEKVDCTFEQLLINELNAGVYCVQSNWLWQSLKQIKLNPKGEYYLTDLVAIAVAQGHSIASLTASNPIEIMGINTTEHLAEATQFLKSQL